MTQPGTRVKDFEVLHSLRNAYQIAQILLERESAETVRAWFVGMNPDLDDRAPALVLGEDPVGVLQIARAFLAQG